MHIIFRGLEQKLTTLISVKEELDSTIKEKDGLQKDLKKLTDENELLLKLRDDQATKICNLQACLCTHSIRHMACRQCQHYGLNKCLLKFQKHSIAI